MATSAIYNYSPRVYGLRSRNKVIKHQLQADQQYVFVVDCDYAPRGKSIHYAEGAVDTLSDWLATHISSALAAGIIKPQGGEDGENNSAKRQNY